MNRLALATIVLISITIALSRCSSNQTKDSTSTPTPKYLNLHDSAKYVGINSCKLCHQDIYNSFIQTGMGKSFDLASKNKSSAKFDAHSIVYDSISNFYYKPYWKEDGLMVIEFRLNKMDTVYKRIEKIDYIVGSGQHTNSHISNSNGYFTQIPLTFYACSKGFLRHA